MCATAYFSFRVNRVWNNEFKVLYYCRSFQWLLSWSVCQSRSPFPTKLAIRLTWVTMKLQSQSLMKKKRSPGKKCTQGYFSAFGISLNDNHWHLCFRIYVEADGVWQIVLVTFLVYAMLPMKTMVAMSLGFLLPFTHLLVSASFTHNNFGLAWQQVDKWNNFIHSRNLNLILLLSDNCQHSDIHQCEFSWFIRPQFDGTEPEEGIPWHQKLHSSQVGNGGWKWKAGIYICWFQNQPNGYKHELLS